MWTLCKTYWYSIASDKQWWLKQEAPASISRGSSPKKPTDKDYNLISLTGSSYDVEGSALNETKWKVVEFYDSDLEKNVKRWRAISYLETPTGLAAKK